MKQATIMEMTIMTTKGIIDETKKKAALSMPVDPENPVITEMNQYQWFENDEGIQIVHEVWTKDGVALTENEVKKVKTVISVESTKENEEDRIEQIEGHAYFFGDEPRIFEWRWKERREDQKSWTKVLLYSGKRSYLLDAEMNEEGGKARFDSRMTAGKYHVYFLGENSVSKLKMLDPGVFSFQPERMEGGRSYVLSYEDNQWILSVTSLVSAVVIEKAKTQKQGVEIQTEKIEIENEIIGADFVLYGTQTKHMEIVSAKLVNGGLRASFPETAFDRDKRFEFYVHLKTGGMDRFVHLAAPLNYYEQKGRFSKGEYRIQTTAQKKMIFEWTASRHWITRKRSAIQYNAMRTVVEKTKVNPRKAIFESYGGRQYSCHPRAIYEYIQEHHPDMDCVWSVEPSEASTFKKMGIPYVKRFSPAWFFAMAKSKYWITNTRFPLWVEKPADTVYLQTWHGTPLKKLGMDIEEVFMPGTTTFQYKRNFYRESRNWDYLISPNRFSTNVFSRAYGLDREKIIESGSPRNDFLVNNKNNQTILEKIKRKRNLPTDKKIILYAPTWRDDEYFSKAKYRYNAALDLNKLKNALKDEYIVLLRMHYLVADNVDLTGVEDFAYNVSDGDITELYLISDLLITDYSSVYFDYAVLNRPMVFFMYDIDDYRDRLRGFYFDVKEHVPGPIVKDNDRLIEAIQNKDADNEKQKRFYQNFCALEDGNATKRVVEQIIG